MTKRNKKIISLFLAFSVLLSMLSLGTLGAGALATDSPYELIADPDDSGKIYFEAPSWWHNYNVIRIYLYNMSTNEALINWNSKKGNMTDEGNGIWSFDFTEKGYTFSDSQNYCCIFLTDTEMTTLELLIGNPCLGDTAYCLNKNYQTENPSDSNKKSWIAVWKNADPAQFAPPLMITSIGNVVGAALPKGVTMEQLLEDFLTESEGNKYLRAITFSGKSSQQLIDDIAQTLGLEVDDVAQAVYNARKAGIDIEWDPEKSPSGYVNPFIDGSGTTGDCEWSFDVESGTLTISGNGAMGDYTYDEESDTYPLTPWYYYDIKEIIIENGVTNIGGEAFSHHNILTKVTIPDSVTSIGEYAFENCDGLNTITIPNGVTEIGKGAFEFCPNLESVTIPEGVTEISEGVFSFCTSLESITIPEGVTAIGEEAFFGCTSLTNVTIPESVKSIGDCAFVDCMFMTSVTIPESVTEIGDHAFGFFIDDYDDYDDYDDFDDYDDYDEDDEDDEDDLYPLNFCKIEDFTIYGKKGTEAEKYAGENEITFIALDETEVVTGDMNGDGKVNGADAGIINRYTSGWEGYADRIKDMKAADINGDGKVNGADSGILNRYTSGWEGYDKYFS